MKKLLENFKTFIAQNEELVQKNYKAFNKAIKNSDTYDDFNWTMDDFSIEHLGMLTLEELEEIVAFGYWVRNEPTGMEELSPQERINSIPEFDSSEKLQAAKMYLERPEIRPPVVLVTAPDSDNDSHHTRIGYGTGLINLHLSLGLDEIEVLHLKYKHEAKAPPERLAGPPGRLPTLKGD